MSTLLYFSRIAALFLAFVFVFSNASVAIASSPTIDSAKAKLEQAANIVCQQSGKCSVGDVTREELTDGIAHYTLTLSVGDGDYDRIDVHRVVKEGTPGQAEPTESNLFMIHGDLWDFETAFMISTLSGAVSAEQAMPIYLAENGVDVWGIDLRSRNIPVLLDDDYDFMAEQGLDTMMSDAGIAIAVARRARIITQQGSERINVLGWSRGAWLVYALANAEAALPSSERQIGGLIPVDAPYKVDPNDAYSVGIWCNAYSAQTGALAGGIYQANLSTWILIGTLAETAPDANSRVVSGYTNKEVAIGLGSLTFALGTPFTPHYHFTAGTFGPGKRNDLGAGIGRPEGLRYTDVELFIDALQLVSPIESMRYLADTSAITCGAIDVPYDDHLAEIVLPVLYVGAAGGFGEVGLYTTTLLEAAQVSVHMVSLETPDRILFDFGHSDLFQAASAEWLVWNPVLQWLKSQ